MLNPKLYCTWLKLMRNETIKESPDVPLWVIPDDKHMVVPIDDGLSCLVPCIIGHKSFSVMIMFDTEARI